MNMNEYIWGQTNHLWFCNKHTQIPGFTQMEDCLKEVLNIYLPQLSFTSDQDSGGISIELSDKSISLNIDKSIVRFDLERLNKKEYSFEEFPDLDSLILESKIVLFEEYLKLLKIRSSCQKARGK